MIKVMHRINTVAGLEEVDQRHGVEADIRTYGGKLVLNHEPGQPGDSLDGYLSKFSHALAVLEIKEEGIEKQVISLCQKHGIEKYFLLSVSFPFQYLLSKQGIRKMAVRFSEFESIDTCISMRGKIDWAWVDTFTKNPLDRISFHRLKEAGLKLCVVAPDRWGRPDEDKGYNEYYRENGIAIDAVMTEQGRAPDWD